jgi:preprotein translocase subunit SecG
MRIVAVVVVVVVVVIATGAGAGASAAGAGFSAPGAVGTASISSRMIACYLFLFP